MHPPDDADWRWQTLQIIHPLFLRAKSLPTKDDVNRGALGACSKVDAKDLIEQIHALQHDLRSNVSRKAKLDIGGLNRGSADFAALKSALEANLVEFEKLVNPEILQKEVQVIAKTPSALPTEINTNFQSSTPMNRHRLLVPQDYYSYGSSSNRGRPRQLAKTTQMRL
jgi:hypothetical protein